MKKSLIVSSMALMASLTIAVAGTSNGIGTQPQTTGGTNGNGTQTVKYTASYTDSFFGSVTCTGVHQAHTKVFGPNGQDSFTCTAQPAGTVLQGVYPGEILTLANFGGWSSDYYTLIAQSYLATAFNGVVSADGTSYTAVANY
jgi:hypothetical protein